MEINVILKPTLPTDSFNYDVITDGVKRTVGVEGMCCEIGLRRGGGTKHIVDALIETNQQHKPVIAIDPYGNIGYVSTDNDIIRLDYTNQMRDECLLNMYLFAQQQKINFLFFNLEDTEFFERYDDGVPIYNETKQIVNSYSFVHFDGPHAVSALKTEIDFFQKRTPAGAVFVFDDVELYDHPQIDKYLIESGWKLLLTSQRKWSYQKK